MSDWTTRLLEAKYESPDGTGVFFSYENVSVSFEKKTSGFEFPNAQGTYVQDLGNSSRRFPMRVIFWGDQYDLDSNIFEAMLRQRGVGKLTHPVYGVRDVVPFGAITRRDDLKTAGNQAIFEVTFWETIKAIYPLSQSAPADDVTDALQAWLNAQSLGYENGMNLDSVTEKVSGVNKNLSLLDKTKQALAKIASTITAVQNRFNAIYDSINNAIDILIEGPLALAQQTINFIQSPARALTSITARLGGYKNLIDTTIFNASNVFNVYTLDNIDANNDFHTDDLYTSGYISGQVTSVINNQFSTSTEALAAAELILDQFDSFTQWRDLNFESLGQIDSSDSYQTLQQTVALTVGFLIQISFTLKQERVIILDRTRTIIDLEAELYGTIDENLNFLIRTNNLSGSSILELQRGQSIVYYA